jgi:hypothetical protein
VSKIIDISGMTAEAQQISPMICPHCKTHRPPYGFHLNNADLGMVGSVQFFTIFCAAVTATPDDDVVPPEGEAPPPPKLCGAIFNVQILQYIPPQDPALLAELARHLKSGGKVHG